MSLRERFNRFRLRSSWTVLVPTICLSGLLLAVGVVAAWQLDSIQATATQTVALNVSSMRASEELEIALREVRSRIKDYLLTKDRSHLNGLVELRRQVDKWLEESRRLATTSTEQEQIQRIEQGYKQLSKDFDRLKTLAAKSDSDAELEKLCRAITLDEMQGMLKAAHEYLDFNEDVITENSARNQALTSRLVPTLLLLGICGALAGVLLGFVIARGVRQRVVECNVPIRDVAGKLNEVLGPLTFSGALDLDDLEPTLRQIADRVQHVVRRLQDSERETLRSEQLAAVGQLAAGMAHELRNPLTSMKVLVQSTLMDDQPVMEGHDLEIMEEEIDRMTQLIAAFLDYARPPQLEKRLVDLVETCQQTVTLILPRASQKGVRFTLRLLKPPLYIEADARQLRQVLLNLFENSLEAMPEGGQLLVQLERLNAPPPPITTVPWSTATEISCADTAEVPLFSTATLTNGDCCPGESIGAASSDNGRVQGSDSNVPMNGHCGSAAGFHLLIADSGHGLPLSLGDSIFQPFVSTRDTGMGLGLSICRRIVQSHNGQITGHNLAGGGTAFSIWLPLPNEDSSEDRPTPLQHKPADHSREYLPTMSVAVR